MVSKSTIKLLQSLRHKKNRQKYHLFVAEGEKCIATLLDHQVYSVHRIFAMSTSMDQVDIGVYADMLEICTKEELKKLSSLTSAPPIIGVFEYGETDPKVISSLSSAIYLDDVQDPGNVGTIIRIADWYGIDAVVRSKDSADFYNPKVVQSSMGSIGHVKMITLDSKELQEHFEDWVIVGASMTSAKNGELPTSTKVCLAVGHEGKGLTPEILSNLTHQIHIRGHQSRRADSLNAAISTGIIVQHIWGQGI